MENRSFRYVLFDLDGTLTDPKEGITKSVQYALKAFGIDEDPDNLTDFIGPPLTDSFIKFYGFTMEDAVKAVDVYRERFSVTGIFENAVYPGACDMLAKLKRQGLKTALATSKPEVFARRILEHFHMTDYFDVIVGSELDGTRVRKGDVIAEALRQLGADGDEKCLAVMVGDREQDMTGAGQNGVAGLGVAFGYARDGELEESGADYIVRTMDELEKFFS